MWSPGWFAALAAATFFAALLVPARGCASDAEPKAEPSCQSETSNATTTACPACPAGGTTTTKKTACPAALKETPELTEAPAAPTPENCGNQIFCNYTRLMYDDTPLGPNYNPNRHNDTREAFELFKNWDLNTDSKISFDEFYHQLKTYLTDFVTLLDRNQDGSILDEAESGAMLEKISFTFFETIFKHAFAFWDENRDKVLTVSDVMKLLPTVDYDRILSQKDQDNNGELSMKELTGTSPANFPGPLYTLYKKIDDNRDEKLSLDEAMSFLKSFLDAINTNSDCYIESKEIVNLLDKLGLPWENQIGVKMVADHYLTFASQVLKVFAEKADTDKDKRVTPNQVIELPVGALKDGKDWDLNLYTMSYLVSPPGAARAVIACPRSNDRMGFRKALEGYDGPGYGYGNQSYGYGTTEDNYGYGGPTNGYGEQSSGYGSMGYGRPSCDQGQMWLEILEELVELLK